MSAFGKYSAYYDLLYRDKDYAAEAVYVRDTIRALQPAARTILELGCGTGRHGRLLAAMGFDVHGIERSEEMIAAGTAASADAESGLGASFTCEVGDICKIGLGRKFDAVVALFHVISYQTSDDALRAVFRVAEEHLALGGVFLLDVWHGPAVVAQGPSARVKEVRNARYHVTRTARPELDVDRATVRVYYDMKCHDAEAGETVAFSEEHLVRYLFPAEVGRFAQAAGLRCIATEEFLTRRPPSEATWGVAYVLKRGTDGVFCLP